MKSIPITFGIHIFGDAVEYDKDGHAFRLDLPAGVVEWLSDVNGNQNSALAYTCPCGCGSVGAISVNKGNKIEKAWVWDGNVDKPSLTPSIQKIHGCRWHGYLTNGEFVPC